MSWYSLCICNLHASSYVSIFSLTAPILYCCTRNIVTSECDVCVDLNPYKEYTIIIASPHVEFLAELTVYTQIFEGSYFCSFCR